jgi:pantoate kinase
MASAKAFCPGHITAFFEVVEATEPLKRGSRGTGFCISKGVTTEVKVNSTSDQKLEIKFNGEKAEAETTELVARMLMGTREFDVMVESNIELPLSQGFGMSGAGALSTALALNEAIDLNYGIDELVGVAHSAEVEAMTGLGDVYPQSLGGLEVRLNAGAPPHGKIEVKNSTHELTLCVLGEELKTKDILRNPLNRKRISEVGRDCLERYIVDQSWQNLFRLSREFAEKTGLIKADIMDAILAVENNGGMAGMPMLGNSIFAFCEDKDIGEVLRDFGDIFQCGIDNQGARLIRQE